MPGAHLPISAWGCCECALAWPPQGPELARMIQLMHTWGLTMSLLWSQAEPETQVTPQEGKPEVMASTQ